MITKEQYARFDEICHKLYKKSSETGTEAGYLTCFNESNDKIFVDLDCLVTDTGAAMFTLGMSYSLNSTILVDLFVTNFGSYVYNEDSGSIDLCDDVHESCVMTLESF